MVGTFMLYNKRIHHLSLTLLTGEFLCLWLDFSQIIYGFLYYIYTVHRIIENDGRNLEQ
jgi:hypothetical protein